jgi:hypothetical protein
LKIISAIFFALSAAVLAFPADSRQLADTPDSTTDLDQLLRQRHYLELESALTSKSTLSPTDRNFFEGVIANRRNRVAESIRKLEPLLASLSVTNKERAIIALSTLADDYEKAFRYSNAADAYAQLETRFGLSMTENERRKARTEAARWNLLRRAPPQSVEVARPFTVPITKDRVGLPEVAVDFGRVRESLILDTGANLSAISLSLAQRLGLKISGSVATARGIAGPRMTVHTAVIPELRLGDARLKNVAVIVIDDKNLMISGMHYRIPGSIGFPVLSALGQITFFADGRLGVNPRPAPVSPSGENLFLQRLTLIVPAAIGGPQRLFVIDTGSQGSFFTSQYYFEHKNDFASQAIGELDLAGAGGVRTYAAYVTDKLNIKMGGACVQANEIPVITETRGVPDDKFYGNIGQRILGQFKSYTLDFQNMSFSAEGNSCPPAEAQSLVHP